METCSFCNKPIRDYQDNSDKRKEKRSHEFQPCTLTVAGIPYNMHYVCALTAKANSLKQIEQLNRLYN